jgi:hypothetical protein
LLTGGKEFDPARDVFKIKKTDNNFKNDIRILILKILAKDKV